MRRLPQWSVRLSSRSDCSALPEYFRHRSPPPTRKRAALPAGGRAPCLRRRRLPFDTWSRSQAVTLLRRLGIFLLVVDRQRGRTRRLLPRRCDPCPCCFFQSPRIVYASTADNWRPWMAWRSPFLVDLVAFVVVSGRRYPLGPQHRVGNPVEI